MWNFQDIFENVSDHLSALFQFAWLYLIIVTNSYKRTMCHEVMNAWRCVYLSLNSITS